MSDGVLYFVLGTFMLGVLSEVVAAVLLLVVAGRGAAAGLRRLAGHQSDGSSVFTPCHSSDCRGNRTVHHTTAVGLQCAECSHIPTR